MRFKLGGLLAAAILVASCGAEEPMLQNEYRTTSIEDKSEDALANLEEKKAMCLSEESCSPIQFDLTILKNGEVEDENGQRADQQNPRAASHHLPPRKTNECETK